MIQEPFIYQERYRGTLFTREKTKRPLILVAPAWRGQDNFAREKAKYVAELGYVGLALDLYGEGKTAKNDEEAAALMEPLFNDRAELRKRMLGALEAASRLDFVDASRVGAIGFCFGGLAVLELLRAGAPIKGAVAFHGLVSSQLPSKPMQGAFLLLNGARDPMVPWSDLEKLNVELTKAGVDWEFDLFGNTVHAFTNPEVHDKKRGLAYDEKIAQRAFNKMELFFKEIL